MEIENKLSIVKTYLMEAIMDCDATWTRDSLIEARDCVEKAIWHIKKDKEREKKG